VHRLANILLSRDKEIITLKNSPAKIHKVIEKVVDNTEIHRL